MSILPCGFDWKKYTNLYSDLKNLNEEQAKKHYLENGIKENRLYHIDNIPSGFDWKTYLELNSELQFTNETDSIVHYLQHGIKENRIYVKKIPIINTDIYNNDKILIVNAIFGLGNRLRAIASAYSICKTKNMQLVIIWIPDCHCDCNIEDLFININEFAITFNKNINIDYLNKFKCYNYLETEENGKKNEYIDFDIYSKVYVKSNCLLNSLYSNNYFLDFFKRIKYNQKINNLIDSTNTDNCIGMHIRMEGGKDNQNLEADKGNNWTKEETELMYTYRNMSHIDRFIEQINYELYNNSDSVFYISTDLKINYDKLINIFGENKIKYIKRDLYDRSSEQINYAIADIILLSKCKKFYGSYWSSFTEIVTYFQKEDIRKTNILSNAFINYKIPKLSIVHVCKNRESNLINSINSYIYNDIVDDIVIVDFNSKQNVKDFITKNIDPTYISKINVIEVVTETSYIASYANNIGLYFCKNENILKLDADNILIDSYNFFNTYLKYDLNTNFIHFDWKNAITENELHLNGIFITTKTQINKYGYHNQNILFYGWEDCDMKNRQSVGKNVSNFDSKYFKHQDQEDNERVMNQYNNNNINFFGFDLRNIISVSPLILYNKTLLENQNEVTMEKDVLSIFNIKENFNKYCKIELNFKNMKTYNTNYNYLSENNLSICIPDIFEKMCLATNYKFWLDYTNSPNIFTDIITKYNISDIKHKILLFYILFFNIKNNIDNNIINNLVITLYNEKSIDRCLELLFCLKTNSENKYISKIHILYENPDKNTFLFEMIEQLSKYNTYNFKSKIIIENINQRPYYNDIFNYCNKNIVGNTIIANSDIVYDNTLENIKYITETDFISLTRYQKYDNKYKTIYLQEFNNKVNIVSQDTWIFMSPLKYEIDCPIQIGKMFCDSLLNYKLKDTKYNCFNLYKTIKSFHVQNNKSESQKMEDNNELTVNAWNNLYKLINKETDKFVYGIKLNTLEEFKNKTNYNKFIEWNTFLHSKVEDCI